MAFYKYLGPNGEAIYGRGKWELPTKGHPGKWMPIIANPVLCARGYHVCEEKDLLLWIRPDCWLVEVRGPEIKGDNKSVFREGRLFRKTSLDRAALHLFAADCAERALKFIKDAKRRNTVSNTLLVVRAFAFGLATDADLRSARAAAWAAAAAADAAAVRARVRVDEKDWQIHRLIAYIHGRVDLEVLKVCIEKKFNQLKGK